MKALCNMRVRRIFNTWKGYVLRACVHIFRFWIFNFVTHILSRTSKSILKNSSEAIFCKFFAFKIKNRLVQERYRLFQDLASNIREDRVREREVIKANKLSDKPFLKKDFYNDRVYRQQLLNLKQLDKEYLQN